jgi:hypothetical protein
MDTRKGMRFTRIAEDADGITVETTGARYLFRTGRPDKPGAGGSIVCTQILNGVREVARLDCSIPFDRLSLESGDVAQSDEDLDAACVLNAIPFDSSCAFLRIEVHRDSLLEITSTEPLVLTVSTEFVAEYHADTRGHLLLIDPRGGLGAYAYRGLLNREVTHIGTPPAGTWNVRYQFDRECRFLFAVFPARQFNVEQYYGECIVHHGTIRPCVVPPFPTDAMLERASAHTRVLVLHEGLWAGKLTRAGKEVRTVADIYAEGAYASYDYRPSDENELLRTIATAHRLGMKVIPYMSPFYSSARERVYWDKVRERLDQYGMDGLYFDGISLDILESYRVIREARRAVGDGCLYVHCTSDPVSRNVFCPFIDTYADYILRAEQETALSNPYLRYVISGYNVSNAIGQLCYYDFAVATLRETIAKALQYRFRFYLGSPETELEQVLLQEYFPRLEQEGREALGARPTPPAPAAG